MEQLNKDEQEEIESLTYQQAFIESFIPMCHKALSDAIKKGFQSGIFPSSVETNVIRISLMHSELSEMMEALRIGNPPDRDCPEFTSAEIELADLFIRGMHFAGANRYRLAEAIVAKMEFNKTREYKHGGKLF